MNASVAALRIAIVGNPNSGKTALFNQLTGTRQKVANYAGVTIERKEGFYTAPSGRSVRVLDLPGAYSLTAASPDEAITRDVCYGRYPGEDVPDLIVCVADATNLRLHLRFVLELKRLGRPMVLALNMMDAAHKRGIRIDTAMLQQRLGMPVVETIAVRRGGTAALVERLDRDVAPLANTLAEDADLHTEVRALLADAVSAPRRTAAADDAIDRVVLASGARTRRARGRDVPDFPGRVFVGEAVAGRHRRGNRRARRLASAICFRKARCAACSSTVCSRGSARCWCSCRRS